MNEWVSFKALAIRSNLLVGIHCSFQPWTCGFGCWYVSVLLCPVCINRQGLLEAVSASEMKNSSPGMKTLLAFKCCCCCYSVEKILYFCLFTTKVMFLKLRGNTSMPEKDWLLCWLLVWVQGLGMPKTSFLIFREVSAVLCAKGQVSVLVGEGSSSPESLSTWKQKRGRRSPHRAERKQIIIIINK